MAFLLRCASCAGTLIVVVTADAAWNEPVRTMAGAAGRATAPGLQSVTTAAQLSVVGSSSNARFSNQAGFLSSFLLRPSLDTDADGLPDEDDPDNDNDGLPDRVEITGTAFLPTTTTDPQSADSDRDGATDAEEAAAGTDPGDAASRLALTRIETGGNQVRLSWQGRQGWLYEVLSADSVMGLTTNPSLLTVVTGGIGTGAWQRAESTVTNTPPGLDTFYRVKVHTP